MNSAWWMLLLLSAFVSPPELTTRGDGFTAFAFATLTGGSLLVALLFFATPSKGMRISSALLAALLLLDAVLVISVARVRTEEGAVGIASALWAFAIAAWSVVADRVVAAAKGDEEVRLTGRRETRRTVREWLAVLAENVVLAVFIAVALLVTANLILRANDASLEPMGERYRVDGGKYDVHLACVGNTKSGERAPTVLLESGENPSEGSFERWLHMAYINGTVARYCFWDRPGYAWSDNAPSPHSAGMSATALAEALARAGEEGPWISVSAGYGSIVARVFSSQHRHAVKGMLLVDPLHEELLGRVAAPGRGIALWLGGVLSPLGLRRVPGALWGGRSREERVFGEAAWRGGKMMKARLQENLVAGSLTRSEVNSARAVQDERTPLVVVSSGVECAGDAEWREKQEDSTRITKRLLGWVVVPDAPHEVWRTEKGRAALDEGLARLLKAGLHDKMVSVII
jgi:pimeloyl-ACP methyl ester carboxylesterase